MELLQLPVQLHGIKLGQPVDVVLDAEEWRALGLVVLCGDDVERFLALPAARLGAEEIAVDSAFLLLEDVDFYREHGRSLRELVGELDGVEIGGDGGVTIGGKSGTLAAE
jgi:hypothetical protein